MATKLKGIIKVGIVDCTTKENMAYCHQNAGMKLGNPVAKVYDEVRKGGEVLNAEVINDWRSIAREALKNIPNHVVEIGTLIDYRDKFLTHLEPQSAPRVVLIPDTGKGSASSIVFKSLAKKFKGSYVFSEVKGEDFKVELLKLYSMTDKKSLPMVFIVKDD